MELFHGAALEAVIRNIVREEIARTLRSDYMPAAEYRQLLAIPDEEGWFPPTELGRLSLLGRLRLWCRSRRG